MDDLQNTRPQTSPNTQVRLKKVKRPINRMTPQAPVMPENQQPQRQPQFSQVQDSVNQTRPQNQPAATINPTSTGTTVGAEPSAAPKQRNPFIQQPAQENIKAPTGTESFGEKPQFTQQNDMESEAFNLDRYLDAEENLPSLNRVPTDYDNGRNPQFIEDEDFEEDGVYGSDLPPYLTKKVLALVAAVIFFMGIVTAKLLFTESKIVSEGLRGVVPNAEVPMGRARCGVAERTQGCVLYLMNPQRQDLSARDFYDLASQLTGRQRFVIETGNMRYSNTKIRPGEIVQLNIPPL